MREPFLKVQSEGFWGISRLTEDSLLAERAGRSLAFVASSTMEETWQGHLQDSLQGQEAERIKLSRDSVIRMSHGIPSPCP